MTKAKRLDTNASISCFPDETVRVLLMLRITPLKNGESNYSQLAIRYDEKKKLLDTLSRILDDEEDGELTGFKIIGKLYLPGDLNRPVSKFIGRSIEITTNKKVVTIQISNA
eukprot:gene6276-9245_t